MTGADRAAVLEAAAPAASIGTWLEGGVHAAIVGSDLVLLDVARDAYFCLPDAGAALSISPLGRVSGLAGHVRRELLEAGLASETPKPTRARRTPTPPGRDLMLARATNATPWERWQFAQVALWAAASFHHRSFASLIAEAGARAARQAESAHMAGIERRAVVFRRLLPWAPVQGQCLFQARLLLDFLARGGLGADWVFGVRTWPFAAHCWLQVGDVVLNDTLERVSRFKPILVI